MLAAVDLPLDVTGSLPASLFSQGDLVAHAASSLTAELLGRAAALDVARDEEADEEVGERGKVDDVDPDGKRLTSSESAGLDKVECPGDSGGLADGGCGRSFGSASDLGRSKDELLERIQGTDGGRDDVVDRGAPGDGRLFSDDVGRGDGGNVCDEGRDHGECSSNDELGDLHGGQGTLQGRGNSDGEGR